MSDEIELELDAAVEPEVTVDAPETSHESETPVTDVEAEAAKKGWKPGGVKSAEEFLRAEPLYEEIKARGKEIKDLKATVDYLKDWAKKQEQHGYNKAMEELKAEKRAAVRSGDYDAVEAVEAKMRELDAAPAEPTAPKTVLMRDVAADHPVVQAFKVKHSSWMTDPSEEYNEVRDYFLKRDADLLLFNLTPEEHGERLEKDLAKKFPGLFGTDVKQVVAVDSSGSKAMASKANPNTVKVKFDSLTKEQKDACRHFEKVGLMTREEYIKELIRIGEIKVK